MGLNYGLRKPLQMNIEVARSNPITMFDTSVRLLKLNAWNGKARRFRIQYPWRSHTSPWFTMINPWWTTIHPWLTQDFPMISQDFTMINPWFSHDFPGFSHDFRMISPMIPWLRGSQLTPWRPLVCRRRGTTLATRRAEVSRESMGNPWILIVVIFNGIWNLCREYVFLTFLNYLGIKI